MAWSDKYKKSINCSNPKGFSQKAHCAGKKKRESIMKVSEFKNFVREISREKFYEVISIQEDVSKVGKIELTKSKPKPEQIVKIASVYKDFPITRITKQRDKMIRVANDLSRLLGKSQTDATKSSGKPALLLQALKNKTIDKKQYVDIYKELLKKHIQLTKKYLPAAQSVSSMGGGGRGARAAARDFKKFG